MLLNMLEGDSDCLTDLAQNSETLKKISLYVAIGQYRSNCGPPDAADHLSPIEVRFRCFRHWGIE